MREAGQEQNKVECNRPQENGEYRPPANAEQPEVYGQPEVCEQPEGTGEEEGTQEDTEQQIAELTDRLLRTMADFDNYRKRTQRERAYMRDDGLRDAIEKLLPVIDNFERAMQSPQGSEDAFFTGMQMILKQLMSTLTDMGVDEIQALNNDFNPELHFAVSHIDSEEYEENKVIEVLQKGYQYKGKVIRPSMVRVAN